MWKAVLWAVICVSVKLTANHLVWLGWEWVASATPIINLFVFASGGLLYWGSLSSDGGLSQAGKLGFVLFATLHFLVYSCAYVSDYYEWTSKIADSQHLTSAAAGRERDAYLTAKGHRPGPIGYMSLVAHHDNKPIRGNSEEPPDELFDIILWAIPRLLGWVSKAVFGLHVDGAINFVFWYLASAVITLFAPLWLEHES